MKRFSRKNEFIRDSVIQRFEFSIEPAWKTAKKTKGVTTSAPKDVIREMAQSGYIEDVAIWLKAIDMRNLSSHTYKENLAEQVLPLPVTFCRHSNPWLHAWKNHEVWAKQRSVPLHNGTPRGSLAKTGSPSVLLGLTRKRRPYALF